MTLPAMNKPPKHRKGSDYDKGSRKPGSMTYAQKKVYDILLAKHGVLKRDG